jgi:hypothetical protein
MKKKIKFVSITELTAYVDIVRAKIENRNDLEALDSINALDPKQALVAVAYLIQEMGNSLRQNAFMARLEYNAGL